MLNKGNSKIDKCIICNNKMTLDDVDFNFKGNQNNYFICEKCNSSCFEKIRYNKSISQEWDCKNIIKF